MNQIKPLTEKQWAYRLRRELEAHRRYEERLEKLFTLKPIEWEGVKAE